MIKMKKVLSLLLVFLLVFSVLTACGGENPPVNTDETTPEATTPAEADNTTTDENVTTDPSAIEVPKSLKILAIGNSFSSDSVEYLCQLLKQAGVENVIIGNLYYGGCSLAQHLSYAKADSGSYTYYKTTSGAWSSTSKAKMSTALSDEEWDYVSLQQASKSSGKADTYTTIPALIDIVRAKVPNAKLMWNMTWAYQSDSTHSSFPDYDKDQMKMYTMIVDSVKQKVVTNSDFSIIIPTGTAVQNARTSFIGDTLTRDGYHLSYNIGRYIAGLTWCAALTGVDVDKITFNPDPISITEDMLKVARESVKNAIAKPFEITKSAIKTTVTTTTAAPKNQLEADTQLAALASIDLSKYTLLTWEYLSNTYWNATSKGTHVVPSATASTAKQFVCSKEKYSLDTLPVGTVFILDEGWQMRLDIFPDATNKYTGTRPGMITKRVFVLTEDYLNGCKYLGWNVSANPKADISQKYAEAATHLRVYVPKS